MGQTRGSTEARLVYGRVVPQTWHYSLPARTPPPLLSAHARPVLTWEAYTLSPYLKDEGHAVKKMGKKTWQFELTRLNEETLQQWTSHPASKLSPKAYVPEIGECFCVLSRSSSPSDRSHSLLI